MLCGEERWRAGFVGGQNFRPKLTGFSEGGMYAVRLSALFQQWFMESGWQQRAEDLFTVAGEVAGAVGSDNR